jgi:argininosuccinate lyase
MEGMLGTMRVNADAMRAAAAGGFAAATDLADYLVGTGMPFRDAHEVVGRLVLACEREGRTLQDLTLEELRALSPAFGPEALDAVALDSVVAARTSAGGTAPERVAEQIEAARSALADDEAWLAARNG